MRICLVSPNPFHNDRRASAIYSVLRSAGNEVVVVAVDDSDPVAPVTATVSTRVSSRGRVNSLARRVLSDSSRKRIMETRLGKTAAETKADIYLPLNERALDASRMAAEQVGATVQRWPGMPSPGRTDLITLAPTNPSLTATRAGIGDRHTPSDERAPFRPEPGRLTGRRAVLCYRKTPTNPGRYIEDAMRRSGLEIRLETDTVDLGSIDPKSEFVLFVESPYPALDVTGETRVPILFWVHHGEHHLHANVRLADRYSADAVLLAHSWHLGPWFPTAIHRFPFAVPEDECQPGLGMADRPYDVSMVGSRLRGDAWQYEGRRKMVSTLEYGLGSDHTRFVEGVTPSEMFDLYGQSKIVLNEGGIRHFPITMRVFEAIGSRALLATDSAPGLEVLFDPASYASLGSDVMSEVSSLLDNLDATQSMADAAFQRALGRHTYDHRVDELVEIAASTSKRAVEHTAAHTELARLVDTDVEVQRVVHSDGVDLAEELPTRETWPFSSRDGRTAKASMDAAVITHGSALEAATMLDMARLWIYASNAVLDLNDYLAISHPDAIVTKDDLFTRVDLVAESYRVDARRSGP